MSKPNKETKKKILEIATGEIKLTASTLKNLRKDDSEELYTFSQKISENKDILYAMQNPASEEEVAEVLKFVKKKQLVKSSPEEKSSSVIEKISGLWRINLVIPTLGFAFAILLITFVYGNYFSKKESAITQAIWLELKQNKGRGFVETKSSIRKKAFYFGFYAELFQGASNDSYSQKELETFLSSYLPSLEFKVRLGKLKKLKENSEEQSMYKEELISFFKDGANRYRADNSDYLNIGKTLALLYIHTLTRENSMEYKKQITDSIQVLEQREVFNEGMISKKNLLEVFKNKDCEKSTLSCEEIRNRIYLIIGL